MVFEMMKKALKKSSENKKRRKTDGSERSEDMGTLDGVSDDPEVVGIRHSMGGYLTDEQILSSDDPAAPMDRNQQIAPELSSKGVEHAYKSAENYFRMLDPLKDKIFFASSNLARALETANIYAEVARTRGFTILRPENVRGKQAEQIGVGDVRVVEKLSIPANEPPLSQELFNSDRDMFHINFGALDEELRERWMAAHKIIQNDDKGSWADNYNAHADKIRAEFPEFNIRDAKESHDLQFKPLMRLAYFGIKKARELHPGESVKILAFGHENYLTVALEQYFGEQGVANCEAVTINLDKDDKILLQNSRGDKISKINL